MQNRYLDYGLRVTYPVGIQEIKSFRKLNIFPNPVNSDRLFVQLELLRKRPVTIQLTDIFGRKLFKEIDQNIKSGYIKKEVNLEGVTPGIYLLQVTVDDEYATKKIVVE